MALKKMNMIVAVDMQFGIAKNNNMAWHLPKEYAHFVNLTTRTTDPNRQNAVIMGRKCWESIPKKFRPLKNRINVVLSRTLEPSVTDKLVICHDLDEALKILTESDVFKDKLETIWNCGGRDIYEMGLNHPWMHKLVVTRIERDFECDLKFPDVEWSHFEENDDFKTSETTDENGVVWKVTSYTKKVTDTTDAKKNVVETSVKEMER